MPVWMVTIRQGLFVSRWWVRRVATAAVRL